VPYFLDGNNLIGRARATARPTDEDARALVTEIASRLRRTRATAVLFFDGPAGGRPLSLGSLTVRYPSAGSADDAIVAEITRRRTPREIVVVTGDRQLARRCRDAGARCLAPDEFWDRFGASPGPGDAETPRVDVEEWMRYFAGERGDG